MEPLEPSDPVEIGGHRLLARLGAGGMGQVYLGLSTDGRHVAIKVIRADFEGPEAIARFRREIETVGAVRSRHTAALVAAGLDRPPYWLATEFVRGPTLAETVLGAGPLPPDTCLRLLAELAAALHDLHGRRVQHRDLKPQNIILSPDGPRLIDFGIAKVEDQTAITRTGVAPGTPGYLAPEVITDQLVGPAADIFALSGVMAYAATGERPFGGGDPHAVLYRSVHNELPLDGIEPELAECIRRCSAKDPAKRPAAGEVRELCGARSPLADDPSYRARVQAGGDFELVLQAVTAAAASRRRSDESRTVVTFPPAPHHATSVQPPGLAGRADPTRGTGPMGRPRSSFLIAGSATLGVVAVIAVVALVLNLLGRGPGDPGGGPTGASGGAGAGGTPTAVLRDRTGLRTNDLVWNSSTDQCEPSVQYEETPPADLQYSSFQPIPKSRGSVDLTIRSKYGAPAGYHVAVEVSPPGEWQGSAGVRFTSKPLPMRDDAWTELRFPQDFKDAFFEPGDWTVIWYHVHADNQAYFILCQGFKVT